jgi:membrane protease YdiL (CAAX protease family)
MALGHRMRRRSGLWPLTIVALILWGLAHGYLSDSKKEQSSTAKTARRFIENTMLAYDDALGGGHPTAWQHWLVLDDSPGFVEDLVGELDKKSLMTDWLWVDAALVYHRFSETTGDARWTKAALAAMTHVQDRKYGSNYFPQVDAVLHGVPLGEADRADLAGYCVKWPGSWWSGQLAHLHGMDSQIDRSKIESRERRAGWQLVIQFVIECLMALSGLILAWPAWKLLRRDEPSSTHRPGDGFRHLRRLWPPTLVLLSFALVGLISPGLARLVDMLPPLSQTWLSGYPLEKWLLIAAAVVLVAVVPMIQPVGMRWCLAQRCGGLRRVFDLRAGDFRSRRWWIVGVAISGILFAVFFGLNWALQKAGFPADETDRLAHSFRELGVMALPFALVWGSVIAPFVEELVFRGFLFTALKNQYGVWAGATISSAIFAWIHFYGWIGTADVFVHGMVFCFVYQRTQRLAASMILHACVNFPLAILTWLEWSA